MKLQRILREPILHFLFIGLALFIAWDRLGRQSKDESRIVITQAVVEDLVRQHRATWNRPPSEAELTGLVEHYIREEVLYREGVSLGLDRDDRMIKRRIRQKVELIAEEESAPGEASDAELADFMTRNPAKFIQPAVVDMDQVFLNRHAMTSGPERAMATVRAALDRGASPATLGHSTLLPRQLEGVPLDVVARDFGEVFARAVQTAPVGEWTATESTYGAHLVRVNARVAAARPALDTIRAAVVREWEHERRQRALAERYRVMREAYQITMDATVPSSKVAESRVAEPTVAR